MPVRPPHAAILAALLLAATALAPAPALAAPGPDTPRATSTCGTAAGVATTEASPNLSISTWTAPGAAWPDLRNASAVRRAFDADVLTPASAGADRYEENAVATGDVVLHRVRLNGSATGLLDRLAAQDTGDSTTNFRSLVESEDVGLRYIGPTACPPTLALNASIDAGAFRVVPDHEADALYLVVDVARLHFEPPGGGDPETDWDWSRHGVALTIRESTGLLKENTTASADYEVDRRMVELEADPDGLVRLDPAPDQPLTGVATMAPGTTVSLELVPLVHPNATATTLTATVDRNGTVATTLDLSNAPEGVVYRVRVPETSSQDPPYTLVPVGNATGASLVVEDQAGIGVRLYATGVTTTHGGFVVARNETTTVAVSDYLPPGAASPQPRFDPLLSGNETLTVTVYRDTDGDRQFDPDVDEPYRVGGAPVTDTANVTVDVSERQTTTEPPTTDPTTTTTPPSSTTQTYDTPDTSRSPTTDAPAPGFGVLVALVGLALSAAGRRHA